MFYRTTQWIRRYIWLVVLMFPLTVQTSLSHAADGEVAANEMDKVVPFEFHGDLRELQQIPLGTVGPRRRPYRPLLTPPRSQKVGPLVEELERPDISGPLAPMPSLSQNFAGLNFSDLCTGGQCGAGWPPDINGDVGPNHYITAVNDAYGIYNKTGTLLASFTENQLWSTGGSNPCNGNSAGDPIVLYDQIANRWILTHFAFAFSGSGNPVSPFYQCIAASKTDDPVSGGWWLYALRFDPGGAGRPPVGALNDYGKFGIWTDCLYMAANEFKAPAFNFIGTAFASFSRSDLYSGAPLTWTLGFINNSNNPFTMIPSNLLGSSPDSVPPAGTPNYFVSESGVNFEFEVRKFTAGPNCGAGGTLSAPTIVSQGGYTFASGNTVPQPNTINLLDVIDDRLMQKVQYRKIGSTESIWVVHNVRSNATGLMALQWAQIDVTGGVVTTTPVQQQVYAPDATLHRWMGSLAVDNQGNMAVGYSTSSGSAPNFPSIAYSGRLASDPLNTLPQTEVQMIAGAGSQTNICGGAPCHRWGDYTAMSVDPTDDCTFWYTNEYYSSQANGNVGNWQTRIGSFKFPSCTAPAFTPHTLTVSSNPSGVDITVDRSDNNGDSNGTTQFTRTYNEGTVVALTAPSTAGSQIFGIWNGCDSSSGVICNVTVDADKSVTATFVDPLILEPALLPTSEVDVAYSEPLVSGGLPPYTITKTRGNYPAGLTPNTADGTLGGTPTAPALKGKKFTVRITDQVGQSVKRRFKIVIKKAITITTNTLPTGTSGHSYSKKVLASGGKTPRTWTEESGSLAALGLSLDPATGVISGTPPSPSGGPVALTFKVVDVLGGEDQKVLNLTIN